MEGDVVAAIKAILEGLRNANNKVLFGVVVDYATNKFDKYPAACITQGEVFAKEATNRQNSQENTYTIMIFVPFKGHTSESAWAKMRELRGIVIQALNASSDLSGNVLHMRPPQSEEPEEDITGSGSNLVCRITIETLDIVDF